MAEKKALRRVLDKREKRHEIRRHTVQAVWTVITNSYLIGFVQGKIYRGDLKSICVPGLNCYSCPGALFACPIGALQAVAGSWKYQMAFYAVGFIMMAGALCGRLICGYLCPFGLFQELLHKIPFLNKRKSFPGDRALRYLKYVMLAVFVILLPMFVVDFTGQGAPYFCKLICPAGTLEGGIPLVLANQELKTAVGWLYAWKIFILAGMVILSVKIYRPFCKYLCPLGAAYGLMNPVSFYRLKVEPDRCTGCGLCEQACPMGVAVRTKPNSPECIRCGACKAACPSGAIRAGLGKAAAKENANENGNGEDGSWRGCESVW